MGWDARSVLPFSLSVEQKLERAGTRGHPAHGRWSQALNPALGDVSPRLCTEPLLPLMGHGGLAGAWVDPCLLHTAHCPEGQAAWWEWAGMLFLLARTVAFQKAGASSPGWRARSVRQRAGTGQRAAWAEVQAGSHRPP